MSDVITIHDAKTHLSKYIQQAKAGKPVYIGGYGKREVMLVPVKSTKRPIKLGIWANRAKGYKDEDIVASDPDIVQDFEDSKVMPDGGF